MNLSIIIVSYNTCSLTLNCLDSIFKETSIDNYEVIVVDNNSQDDSASLIASRFPQVKLLTNGKNIGFAMANNLAASIAKGEYLLLLNSDTVVMDSAIDKLYKFAERNPQAGIYGGRTIFPDGKLNPTSCFGKVTLWSLFCGALGLTRLFKNTMLFNPEGYGSWNYDTDRYVDIITGCFLLTKAELWRELKGFNPLFVMYSEESDFCLRARKLGHKLLFNAEAEIIHYKGASEAEELNRSMNILKGEVTLIKQHWARNKCYWGVRLLIVRVNVRRVVSYVLSKIDHKRYGTVYMLWKELWEKRDRWLKGWVVGDEL